MKRRYNNLIVIFIFAFLSWMFSYYFIKIGGMVLDSDSSFHISRVEEIYLNLREGKLFTFIATRTFSNSGVGNFMFYPTLFLYPWALLRFIFNPVTSFYLWYGFFMFLTMVISYYSMLSYSSSKIRSYAFALVYSLAAYHIHLGLWHYVLGEFIAYTFIPLAFLGIYHILFGDSKKWKILGCGMALIMYAHLLSVYITALILVLITLGSIIYRKGIAKERLASLVKSAVLALLLVSPQLLLFITDYKGLGAPQKSFVYMSTVTEFIDSSLNNTSGTQTVGLVIIIVAFIGWYFVRNKSEEITAYVLGLGFLLLATRLIPWDLLTKTFVFNILGQVQFPYRFNTYSSFFLAVTASLIIQEILVIGSRDYLKFVNIIALTIVMVISYESAVTDVITRIDSNRIHLKKSNKELVTLPVNAYVDKDDYSNIFTYLVLFGETDYYPKQSYASYNNINSSVNAQTIVKHEGYLNKRKISIKLVKTSANTIIYKVKATKDGKLDLPVVKYPHTKVILNGNATKFDTSDRGTIQVNVNKGINNIMIRYQPSKLFYVGIGIAVITWGILLVITISKGLLKIREHSIGGLRV